jgi:hypothetical protein
MTDGLCGLGIWLANILWTSTAAATIAAPADTSRTRLSRSPITAHNMRVAIKGTIAGGP